MFLFSICFLWIDESQKTEKVLWYFQWKLLTNTHYISYFISFFRPLSHFLSFSLSLSSLNTSPWLIVLCYRFDEQRVRRARGKFRRSYVYVYVIQSNSNFSFFYYCGFFCFLLSKYDTLINNLRVHVRVCASTIHRCRPAVETKW